MKVTVKDIAAAMKIARRKAAKWLAGAHFELQATRGGKRKLYREEDLPAKIRAALALCRSQTPHSTHSDSAPEKKARASAGALTRTQIEARAHWFDSRPAKEKAPALPTK